VKILHTVEFYYPSVGGAQEVVRQLSEHMAAAGHDVTVATSRRSDRDAEIINGVRIAEFDVSGNAVRGYQGSDVDRYKELLVGNDFDVIMNYAAQQWATDLFFEVIDSVRARKVLVPCGYSALYAPSYGEYFARMPELLEKYDATVYLAEHYRDIDFAREHGASNLHIIPNAADEREFGSLLSNDERERIRAKYGVSGKLVLTIGSHTGNKGHRESMLAFLLAPFVHGTLAIVGNDGTCRESCEWQAAMANRLGRLLGKKVLLLDIEREDTVRLFKAANVFLFLSNIEASPLVLFEAAAAGTPFVASRAGNSKEIAHWTQGGITVRSPATSNGYVRPSITLAALRLGRLLLDPISRKRTGERGRLAWEKQFTWDQAANRYLELYEGLVRP
jgi:L-malate glycosyltransferase